MAAVLTGTPIAIAWGASANPAPQSITIPADATAAYMAWAWDGVDANGEGLASSTLASSAPSQTGALGTATGFQPATGICAWYNPPTGAQDLDVAWTAAPVEGPVCIVFFTKDGNTTTWRDADAAHAAGATAVGVVLTTEAGDLVVKFDQRYDAAGNAPVLTSGWTNGQTQTAQQSENARLSYISATGTSTACDCENEDYSSIVAIAIGPFAGGAATVDQEGARLGADDGSESAHTWLAAQDANATVAVGTAFLVRMLLNGTGDAPSASHVLRYQKNGTGGFVPVPVGSGNAEVLAQPTWGAVGTAASGATSCTPAYPTGITAATSKLFCAVTGRSNAANTVPTMPAGWTRIGGLEDGTGTWAVDTGPRRVDFFQKDLTDGTETGTVTVSLGGTTANTLRASIFRVEVPSGYLIDVALGTGADTSNDTSYSAASSTSLDLDANRLLVLATAQNLDTGTATSRAVSASGITFGTLTNRADTAVTNGNDHRHIINSVPVSSGSGTVAPTFSYTVSAAASGPTAFLVLRARLAATTNEIFVAPSANIAAGGEATTARLTAPSGKTTADFVTGRRWDDENGTDAIDLTTDDYTELEWSLNTQAPATSGDAYEFRVYAGASALDTYTVTPQVTLGAAPVDLPPQLPQEPLAADLAAQDPNPFSLAWAVNSAAIASTLAAPPETTAAARAGARADVAAAKGAALATAARAGARAAATGTKAATAAVAGRAGVRGDVLAAKAAAATTAARAGARASVTAVAAIGRSTSTEARAGARADAAGTKATSAATAGRVGVRADQAATKAAAHVTSGRAGARASVTAVAAIGITTGTQARAGVRADVAGTKAAQSATAGRAGARAGLAAAKAVALATSARVGARASVAGVPVSGITTSTASRAGARASVVAVRGASASTSAVAGVRGAVSALKSAQAVTAARAGVMGANAAGKAASASTAARVGVRAGNGGSQLLPLLDGRFYTLPAADGYYTLPPRAAYLDIQ